MRIHVFKNFGLPAPSPPISFLRLCLVVDVYLELLELYCNLKIQIDFNPFFIFKNFCCSLNSLMIRATPADLCRSLFKEFNVKNYRRLSVCLFAIDYSG